MIPSTVQRPWIRTCCRVLLVLALWGAGCQHANAQEPLARGAEHRDAFKRSLELIRGSVDRYPQHRDCFSCHHQAVPLFALHSARKPSFGNDGPIKASPDTERIEQILEFSRKSLESHRDDLRAGKELDGRGLTLGYALWTEAVGKADWGELHRDLLDNALATQQPDGRWRVHSIRPPAAASDAMATALVLFGLIEEAKARIARRQPFSESLPLWQAVYRARRWMLRQSDPTNTEDACGLLWIDYLTDDMANKMKPPGIPPGHGGSYADDPAWKEWLKAFKVADAAAGRAPVKDRSTVIHRLNALLEQQNEDGGWGQDAERDSDAYSTATVLLLWAETNSDYKLGAYRLPGYRKGLDYLIRTQGEDGSWHVSSRATPVQEYFDNGDPHETDQFISMMATSWSASVLANAWYQRLTPLSVHD